MVFAVVNQLTALFLIFISIPITREYTWEENDDDYDDYKQPY